jgi:hypothetical protein
MASGSSSTESSTKARFSSLYMSYDSNQENTNQIGVYAYRREDSSSSSSSLFLLDTDRSSSDGCAATATLALYIGSYSLLRENKKMNTTAHSRQKFDLL